MKLQKKDNRLTVEEYLGTSRLIPHRHEFIDRYIVKLERSSVNHARIISNLRRILEKHLTESGCEVFTSDVAIEINGSLPQPDIVVSCNGVDQSNQYLTDALLIFEILSTESKSRDQGPKTELYREIPSIKEYIIIDQYQRKGTLYRIDENRRWRKTFFHSFSQSIALTSLGLEISLDDIYNKVEW